MYVDFDFVKQVDYGKKNIACFSFKWFFVFTICVKFIDWGSMQDKIFHVLAFNPYLKKTVQYFSVSKYYYNVHQGHVTMSYLRVNRPLREI